MKRILVIVLLLMVATALWSIPGDLNLDGKVDFEDFFLFADQFGKEGPPDTLWVVVMDTTRVIVEDTARVTVYDTVTMVNPVVGEYEAWPDVYEVIDMDDPRNGLRSEYIGKGSDRFRLGPDLAFQDHAWGSVAYFENGKYHEKKYLRPSGHLLEESIKEYSIVEVRRLPDGILEVVIDEQPEFVTTRYLYDENMDVVGTETSKSYWVEGRYYYYFEERAPGVYDILSANSRTAIPTNFGFGVGTWEYTPFDMDKVLGR